MFQHPSSNSVCRVFFDPGQCGFCGFQRGQCGFSGSVGGSVASTNDNVGVEGAVFGRFQAGGERGAISGRRMTKRRGRARFSNARGL